MPQRHPTVDELVSTLRRSKLPTVIVEGRDDMQIFRWMENLLEVHDVDVLGVGGRPNLFAVYDRKSEFVHLPVAFVADRDKELFTQLPSGYEEIIWTQGYSIENDLYAGADHSLENLMDPPEAAEHGQVLNTIIKWFAFEVEEFLAGRTPEFNHHCNEVVPQNQTEMDDGFRQRRGFRLPNLELQQQIREAYQLQLKGKLLFQMLVRFLSKSNRRIKHSLHGLYEIAFKMTPIHPLMNRIIQEIERKITSHSLIT